MGAVLACVTFDVDWQQGFWRGGGAKGPIPLNALFGTTETSVFLTNINDVVYASCSWCYPGTSASSATNVIMSLCLYSSGSNTRVKVKGH